MGAMLEEVAAIVESMVVNKTTTVAGRAFHQGALHGHDATVVFSRWGKVAAASTVTSLIETHGAEMIVFTGVAGALEKSLNIGDVEVANELFQHYNEPTPIFPKHNKPLTDASCFRPTPEDIDTAKAAAESLTADPSAIADLSLLAQFSITNPTVHVGPVASGDVFLTGDKSTDSLRREVGDPAIAIEMEGAAVAQVCTEYGVPYIVFRTISDKADHSAVIDFPKFVTEVASRYSAGLVRHFLTNKG